MIPKEKAEELVDKFKNYVSQKDFFGDNVEFKNAQQCALITVDEILAADMFIMTEEQEKYWEQVKTEIEKL
jgi:hypothetical protein